MLNKLRDHVVVLLNSDREYDNHVQYLWLNVEFFSLSSILL